MNSHDLFTNPFELFERMTESAFRALEEVQDIANSGDGTIRIRTSIPNKVDKCICCGDFPPSNIYIKDGNYNIDFACAGYTEDDIEIEYKDNYIYTTFHAPKVPDSDMVVLKQGIRMRDEEVVSVFVNSQKYDVGKIEVTLSNGILHICVKANDSFVKRYSVGINGNSPKQKAIEVDESKDEEEPSKD